MSRFVVATVAVAALTGAGAVVLVSPAQSAPPASAVPSARTAETAVSEVRLRSAVAALPRAAEKRAGYSRAKFTHWTDDDRDCQDTRSEVLRQESRTGVSGSCTVRTGKWRSYYDGKTWRRASDVDVDHLVALAEAWDSGARAWSASVRRQFANDLGDKRALVAVTDNVNSAKGDRDPADWMPAEGRCRYVREWVAVKVRWGLTVDRAEKRTLTRHASTCKNVLIKVTRVSTAPPKPVLTPCPTPLPTPMPTPTATPAPPTPEPTADPEPEPTPQPIAEGPASYMATAACVPSPTPTPTVYYANCDAARAAGAAPIYRGEPGYRAELDGDNDGVACE